MNHFNKLPEFEKEFSKLSKKYRSLQEDLNKFEKFIKTKPTGLGKNFTIIYDGSDVKVVKARLACRSLKDRSVRIIYAHHETSITFVYIEIYFKGDKNNEDRDRIKEYIKSLEMD